MIFSDASTLRIRRSNENVQGIVSSHFISFKTHFSILENVAGVAGTYDPLQVFTVDKNWFKRPIYIS